MASIANLIPGNGDNPYLGQPVPLNSPTEASPIVRYLRMLTRWWLPIAIILSLTIATGLIAYYLVAKRYTATAVLQIARDADKVVEVRGVQAGASINDLEFYQTQYGLLKARSLAERVATGLKLDRNAQFFNESGAIFPTNGTPSELRKQRLAAAAGILLRNITIAPVRSSRLVNVSYESTNPAQSATITNAWVQGFIDEAVDNRFEATDRSRAYLKNRLAELEATLEDKERLAVGYASNQQLVTIGGRPDEKGQQSGQRSVVEDSLSSLNSELAKATAERISAQSRLSQSGGGSSSAESLGNQAISALRQKRAELGADYAKMMVTFEPGYPPARALQQQIQTLERSIAAEEGRVRGSFHSAYREAAQREAELKAKVNSLQGEVVDSQRRSIQYNIYQRDADTTRGLYNDLLQRSKEMDIAAGVGATNITIIDNAMVPSSPSNPKLFLNLLLAGVAGLVLSAAAIFLLEQLVDSISDPDDLKRDLNIPLLGTIPMSSESDPLVALADPKSDLVEAYFSAQANLQFATDHGVPRSMMVTSTRPSEGKSTSSFALAQTLARTGKKVVIIDGDLRSPSLHHILGWRNDKGLSNYLTGSDDLDGLVRPVGPEGMFAMVGGPMPPNAAELLSGRRIDQLIDDLKARYDVVLFDAPPVMGLADAPLLASKVEGTVFAVESNGTRKRSVRVALDRLRAANAHIVGGLLTKFESKRAYYGYGYEYGYGYGGKKDGDQAAA